MSKTPTKEMIERMQASLGHEGVYVGNKTVERALTAALQSAADTPPDIDQVATRIASKYLTLDISCERLYHDVVEALTAERAVASRKAAADTPPPQSHTDWQAVAEHYRLAMLEVERRISSQPVREMLPGQSINETAKFISDLSQVLWEARQKVIFKEPLAAPAPETIMDGDDAPLTVSYAVHQIAHNLLLSHTGMEGGCPRINWYKLRSEISDAIAVALDEQRRLDAPPQPKTMQISAADDPDRPWEPWSMMPVGDQRNIIREVLSEDGQTALAYFTGKFMALAPISENPEPLPFKVWRQRRIPSPQPNMRASILEEAAKVAETGDYYGRFQTAGDERRAKAIAERIRALATTESKDNG